MLDYHNQDDRIPIFDPNKDRVIISAYTMFYYAVKISQKYHDEEVLMATIKTMAGTFLNVNYFDVPEDFRPKGYEGLRKMGMELLAAANDAALENAAMKCRTETGWNNSKHPLLFYLYQINSPLKCVRIYVARDAIVSLYERCHRCAENAFNPPPNINGEHYEEIIKRFNDSAVCLTQVLELLQILIPRDRLMRLRLRHYDTTTTICKLIDIFVAKPDTAPGSHRHVTPVAAFSRVPKPAREHLGQMMKCCAKYLQALYREWSADDVVDGEMMSQRDIILELAAEGDVAGELLLRAERAIRF